MMNSVKLSIVVFFTAICFSYAEGSDKNKLPDSEDCYSYISILGSSNVNQFEFTNANPQIETTTANPYPDRRIKIPVYSFEASNKRMLSDFHEMVKAEEHPYIDITIEPRHTADFEETSGLTRFRTVVTIAGKSNEYIVPSHISGCTKSGYMLQGDLEVKLTDFGIDPPTKVFGAVKVNDNVFINFAFQLPEEVILTEQVQD